MYRPKVKYEPIDLIFLNENFGKMGLFALVDAFNEIRPANAKVSLPSLRHQLRRMGLYKKILIHWSAADTKFLQANYGRYGDVELAEMLNHRRGTYKIIDGKKVFRTFTKKHVEKKMKLLGLHRTHDEFLAIRRHNIDTGRQKCFTATDNAWTRGKRVATPEGDTVTNKGGMYIKINNTLIPFPRWFYENFVAPIPQGHVVYHADGDVFNNEIDNLVCAPRQRYFNAENTEKAIRSLKARKEQLAGTINANDRKIKSTLDFKNYEKMIAENRQLYKDFRRIEKLLKKFENQINHAGYRKRT